MAQRPPASPFKVMAVNVNGLAARSKRRPFFASLQKQRQSVVLLSETHTTSDSQGHSWVQEGAGPGRPWAGAAFFCSRAEQEQRATRGVGILIGQHLIAEGLEPVIEHQSPSGRVLKVSWVTPWGDRLAAVAVYAPCEPSQRNEFFWGEYLDSITSGTQDNLIVGGDFNCVMREEDVLAATPWQAAASSRNTGGAGFAGGELPGRLEGRMAACSPRGTSADPLHSRQGVRGAHRLHFHVSRSVGWWVAARGVAAPLLPQRPPPGGGEVAAPRRAQAWAQALAVP